MGSIRDDLRGVLLSPREALSLDVRGGTNAAVLVLLYVEDVEILGALQPTPTVVTGYVIYPFVGMIEPGQTWTASAVEVAEVIELPLRALLAGYGRRRLIRRGLPFRTDTYVVSGYLVWGATARILADLFDRVGPFLDHV